MAFDRFLIAPFDKGVESDLKPWQIPDDAFAELENAYIFRGRVKKRFGADLTGVNATAGMEHLYSRLAYNLGKTHAGTGVIAGTVPGTKWEQGQLFSIADVIFTVADGTPGAHQMLRTDGSAEVATFNVTNGAYTITIAAQKNVDCYWYPAQPVTGITQYHSGAINNEPTWAFDTQFAYKFKTNRWVQDGAAIWQGDKTKLFLACNWNGLSADKTSLFVTNFNVVNYNGVVSTSDDPIWSYDGTANATAWAPFKPRFRLDGLGPTNYVVSTARIVLPFKDCLILLNTVETDNTAVPLNQHFPNRCRYSHNGSPLPAAPEAIAGVNGTTNGVGGAAGTVTAARGSIGDVFTIGGEVCTVVNDTPGAQVMNTTGTSVTHTFNCATGAYVFAGAAILTQIYYLPSGAGAWLEGNQPGANGAGWIDAATEEEIVSAGFIKDRLIVYFERSTWELAYTGNYIVPFLWQKINTELGAESTFSAVTFDKVLLAVGQTGIHACTGATVQRIDAKIPDEVFDIDAETNGIAQIVGIRDFDVEMVYWSLISTLGSRGKFQNYPNKVLVFNYKNNTWAMNDDCITAFGYYQEQYDKIWSDQEDPWKDIAWSWNSGIQSADHRKILAGNQQGYVFTLEPDKTTNAPVMSITDIKTVVGVTRLTIIDHNLQTALPGNTSPVGYINCGDYIRIENSGVSLVDGIWPVTVINEDTISIPKVLTGVYPGNAIATRVSNINILSKQWNPYVDKDFQFQLSRIDFNIDKTSKGEVTVDYYPSYSTLSINSGSISAGTMQGDGRLETFAYPVKPLEAYQDQLWHPVYFQAEGDSVQIRIYMSHDQITDEDISASEFEINAMILYTRKTSTRL